MLISTGEMGLAMWDEQEMNAWPSNGCCIACRTSPLDYKYTAASHSPAQIEAASSLREACTSSRTAGWAACPTSCRLHFVLMKQPHTTVPLSPLVEQDDTFDKLSGPFLQAAARWPMEAATVSDLGDQGVITCGHPLRARGCVLACVYVCV